MEQEKLNTMHSFDSELDDMISDLVGKITPEEFAEYYGIHGTELEKRLKEATDSVNETFKE